MVLSWPGPATIYFPHITDPEMVEILACKHMIQLAGELDVHKIHVELDSKAVVQMLLQQSKNLSAAGLWVEEIKSTLSEFSEFRVSWVKRSVNVAVHKLARVGAGDERCQVWREVAPDCILGVISDDIPNFVS